MAGTAEIKFYDAQLQADLAPFLARERTGAAHPEHRHQGALAEPSRSRPIAATATSICSTARPRRDPARAVAMQPYADQMAPMNRSPSRPATG